MRLVAEESEREVMMQLQFRAARMGMARRVVLAGVMLVAFGWSGPVRAADTQSATAILDNAPTYLAFLSMAQHLPDAVAGTTHLVLSAISCGSVFFGAMTYIGNGPNFMVKAIAEHAGIKMPSFFGYLAWSSLILLPIFALATVLFFR